MSEKIVYGYYVPNSYKRADHARFEPFNIDPHLCTHIGYYRFGVHENGIIRHVDDYLDKDLNLIGRILHLRTVNPSLKIMAVFGGWDEGSEKFSQIAAIPEYRAMFINLSIAFCKKYGFDGIDLDWCYPGKRNSNCFDDKTFYSLLVKELRESCTANGLQLFLSVGATRWTGDSSYDIPLISYYSDLMILKTYDFHGAWEEKTGANTPLYDSRDVNIRDCVKYWLDHGAPAHKLLLGLAFYGQTFTLNSPDSFHMGAKTIGKGNVGPYTQDPGNIAYNEIVTDKSWTMYWDDTRKIPYGHWGNQWVSFDNERSIELKCKFVKDNGLAGVMVNSIDYDDFLGWSGTIYPLLNVIKRTLMWQ